MKEIRKEESEQVIRSYEWVMDREGFLVKREIELSSMKADQRPQMR